MLLRVSTLPYRLLLTPPRLCSTRTRLMSLFPLSPSSHALHSSSSSPSPASLLNTTSTHQEAASSATTASASLSACDDPSDAVTSPSSSLSLPSYLLHVSHDNFHYKTERNLINLFQTHHIAYASLTKPHHSSTAILSYDNDAARTQAEQALVAVVDARGKKRFKVKRVDEDAEQRVKRMRSEQDKQIKHDNQRKRKQRKREKGKAQRVQQEGEDGEENGEAKSEDDDGSEREQSEEGEGSEEEEKTTDGQQQDSVMQHENGDDRGDCNSSSIAPRSITSIVTPLAHLPYASQLQRKTRFIATVLKSCASKLRQAYPAITFPYQPAGMRHICRQLPIVPSPLLDGYRNKCEFTCGLDEQNEASVGFLLGKFTEGQVMVAGVDDCRHVSDAGKLAARVLQQYLRESVKNAAAAGDAAAAARYTMYDKRQHRGVWRLLIVRNTTLGEVMICAQIADQHLPADTREHHLQLIKQQLLDLYTHPDGHFSQWCKQHDHTLASLQLQVYNHVSNAAPDDCPSELLHGSSYIHESLLNTRFRISLNSFFQVNTRAAELLYTRAAELAGLMHNNHNNITLLDVCCGTGSIGLCLSQYVQRVIGLELVAAAVDDARFNAAANNRTKQTIYITGPAENTLELALRQHTTRSTPLVAIVDPPRSGLHSRLVRLLRSTAALTRLVYITCNPRSCAEDLFHLCQQQSKKFRGEPFVCVQAVPVDLFPHTEHCELIVTLERANNHKQQTHATPPSSSQPTSTVPPAASSSSSTSDHACTLDPTPHTPAAAAGEVLSTAAHTTNTTSVETTGPAAPSEENEHASPLTVTSPFDSSTVGHSLQSS